MFFLYVKNQSQFYNQVKNVATEQQNLPLFIFSKNFIFISRFGRLKKIVDFLKVLLRPKTPPPQKKNVDTQTLLNW